MAKTIKFNLICNNNPVRTLEDLRNNFSIEDVLDYYHNELLHRWLEVHGYSEELTKVRTLKQKEDLSLIKELITIFEIETDITTVEKDTYILSYQKERMDLLDKYEQQSFKSNSILEDYQVNYQKLVATILDNRDNMAKIKAGLQEIDENYSDLFNLDFKLLFYAFYFHAPMVIFAMLMRKNMREKYLPSDVANTHFAITTKGNKNKDNIAKEYSGTIGSLVRFASNIYYKDPNECATQIMHDTLHPVIDIQNSDKNEIFNLICSLVKPVKEELEKILEDNLQEFSGVTEGYWKDVEPKGKHYLILHMDTGNFVRSSGESGGDLDGVTIKNRFVILDGIDYKSNNANHKLFYLEV